MGTTSRVGSQANVVSCCVVQKSSHCSKCWQTEDGQTRPHVSSGPKVLLGRLGGHEPWTRVVWWDLVYLVTFDTFKVALG